MTLFKRKIKNVDRRESKTTNPHTLDGIINKATDDRYMNLALSKRNWQIAAFGLLIANMVQAVVVGYIALHSKVDMRVALINDGVVMSTLETSELSSSERSKIIEVSLENFIKNVRLVSNDVQLEKSALNYVYSMASGQALNYINDWYQKNDPFQIAAKYTVSINIVNFLKLTEQTWQITWDETKRNITDGKSVSTTRWIAQLSSVVGQPLKTNVRQNPFGIYVTQLSWSQSE